jgi:hypothetical protein
MRHGLEDWLEWHKASSLDEMRGTVGLETNRDPGAFERAHTTSGRSIAGRRDRFDAISSAFRYSATVQFKATAY